MNYNLLIMEPLQTKWSASKMPTKLQPLSYKSNDRLGAMTRYSLKAYTGVDLLFLQNTQATEMYNNVQCILHFVGSPTNCLLFMRMVTLVTVQRHTPASSWYSGAVLIVIVLG